MGIGTTRDLPLFVVWPRSVKDRCLFALVDTRRRVLRKLDQTDTVTRLDSLKVPPGNRLHALAADMAGFHAIRVNDQYRVVFRFAGQDAFDVRCTDDH